VCFDGQLNTKHHAHMTLEHAKVLITRNVAMLEFNNALRPNQLFEDGDKGKKGKAMQAGNTDGNTLS